jgi:hypothetical protein
VLAKQAFCNMLSGTSCILFSSSISQIKFYQSTILQNTVFQQDLRGTNHSPGLEKLWAENFENTIQTTCFC